jgi:hypothetical protein
LAQSALTQFKIQPRFGGAFLLPCIDTVQGFCFARRRISQAQAFTAAFLPSMQIIRQKRQNRLQGFTAAFPLICPIPAHTTQQPHKPPTRQLRHAGGHTVKRSTSTDTRYNRHAGRCTA